MTNEQRILKALEGFTYGTNHHELSSRTSIQPKDVITSLKRLKKSGLVGYRPQIMIGISRRGMRTDATWFVTRNEAIDVGQLFIESMEWESSIHDDCNRVQLRALKSGSGSASEDRQALMALISALKEMGLTGKLTRREHATN